MSSTFLFFAGFLCLLTPITAGLAQGWWGKLV